MRVRRVVAPRQAPQQAAGSASARFEQENRERAAIAKIEAEARAHNDRILNPPDPFSLVLQRLDRLEDAVRRLEGRG